MGFWDWLTGKKKEPDVVARPFVGWKPAPELLSGTESKSSRSDLEIAEKAFSRTIKDKPFIPLDGDGNFEFDIVGESKYQNALDEIAGPKGEESASFRCLAYLIREPKNRFDPNAIKVEISGRKVGYVPRDVAAVFSIALERRPNFAGYVADALIVGGWKRPNGSEGSYGVKLDINLLEDDDDDY